MKDKASSGLRRPLFVAALAIVLAAGAGASPYSQETIPAHPFQLPPSVGPLGRIDESWVDRGRPDRTAADRGPRHLAIRILYPATVAPGAPRAPYIPDPTRFSEVARRSMVDAVAAAPTNEVAHAAVSSGKATFPVLLYNPGLGSLHVGGTQIAESLAARGYVVVMIGRPDTTPVMRFDDGYTYTADPDLATAQAKRTGGLAPVDVVASDSRWRTTDQFPAHVADLRFVIDRLRAMANDRHGLFYRKLDLTRIGAFGFSLGGVIALQASRDIAEIKAAANLDGAVSGDIHDTGTSRPILMLHNDGLSRSPDPAIREMAGLFQQWLWRTYRKSTNRWFDVTIDRTTHLYYSDAMLLRPPEPGMSNPAEVQDIAATYLGEFFDHTLLGCDAGPYLSGRSAFPTAHMVAGGATAVTVGR